jgi:peroxiredoxin
MTNNSPQPASDWNDLYDRFIAGLRTSAVGVSAPQPGSRFPQFALPNTVGRYVNLSDRLGAGPLVLSFMRGGWCPHCRSELAAWAEAIPRLEDLGGRFIAVSGEAGGMAETTRCKLAPDAEMLCDIDHGLALALGLTFPLSQEMFDRYHDHGLDLADIYGDSGRLLPVPATFVLDASGIVRYAFVEPDFRIRPEPAVVMAAVEACATPSRTH